MHSAIVYAVMPVGDHEWSQEASLLRAAVSKAVAHQSVKPLGDFVWEVNFREGPDALGLLIVALEARKRPYGILPIYDAPQWIRREHPI